MKKTSIKLNENKIIGKAKRQLYSSFIEHIGRAIYGGIYEPDHATADENGFRQDVIELAKSLSVSYIRYPGGNFVSQYNWKDGIGPKEKRPLLPNLAWHQLEPNLVGIDEFLVWCEKVGCEPIVAVNMGTGTPLEACELLQYCNGTVGYWAEERKKNGHEQPYNVKYWCMGNEMDSDLQIGHLTAQQYAEKASLTAQMMKAYDPNIKLVFCGSTSFVLPTFPEWDRTVLRVCFNYLDFISCHRYYQYDKKTGKDKAEFIGAYKNLDNGIKTLKRVIKEICEEKGIDKPIKISMDEWNIWYQGEGNDDTSKWFVETAREEPIYSDFDATVFASLVSTLQNNTDIIEIACLAQLINVIAPIMTKHGAGAVKQTIYYPFYYAANLMIGDVLECEIECPMIDAGTYGMISGGQASVVKTEDGIVLMYTNLTSEELEFSLDNEWAKFTPEYQVFSAAVGNRKNTFDNPNAVVPEKIELSKENKTLVFKPYSWNIIKFSF